VLPVRVRIKAERCRGCGRCVDACSFEAIELQEGADGRMTAHIEAALCRGCNLCRGACPTEAAVPTALSPEWWGSRLDDAFEHLDDSAGSPLVVLACQRRAGALEEDLSRSGKAVEVIRFRCVGQIDAGMLVQLRRQGAGGMLVAGCLSDRCRFGAGAHMALEQVDRARQLFKLMGDDPEIVRSDWSADREHDPLDESVQELLTASPKAAKRTGKAGKA
jgi:coenzyme F420-reducing hydrogenase delta subunit/NAD-dependent dihydropyrimidine dehydrogenase PreA subunit